MFSSVRDDSNSMAALEEGDSWARTYVRPDAFHANAIVYDVGCKVIVSSFVEVRRQMSTFRRSAERNGENSDPTCV
jgi:hypothetical protein